MNLKTTLVAAGLMLASAAFAQPSIYFMWKQTATGKTMCNPDAPSAGWVQVGGPFQDPNCKIPEPK